MDGQDEARASAVLVEMQNRVIQGPHAALGVPMHATAADIRTAFLELTKIYHPARFGRMSPELQRMSNEVFLALRAAHDALAKPRARPSAPAIAPSTNHSQPPPVPGRGTGTAPFLRAPSPPAISRTPTGPIAVHPPRTATGPQPTVPAPRAPTGQLPTVASQPPATNGHPAMPPRPNGQVAPRPNASAPPAAARPTVPAARTPGEARSTPAYGVRIQPGIAPATPASRQTSAMPVVATAPELAPIYELMQRGQWEQARAAIVALSAKAPASPRYRALLSYTRGREAQLDRRLDEARVELDTALQLDPDLQLAKTALAELFTRRK